MTQQEWPEIVVFGTSWCGDCRRTERFLERHEIPFRYHDVDKEDLGELVITMNEKAGFGPRRRVPTLTVDGEILSVPTDRELSELLGVS